MGTRDGWDWLGENFRDSLIYSMGHEIFCLLIKWFWIIQKKAVSESLTYSDVANFQIEILRRTSCSVHPLLTRPNCTSSRWLKLAIPYQKTASTSRREMGVMGGMEGLLSVEERTLQKLHKVQLIVPECGVHMNQSKKVFCVLNCNNRAQSIRIICSNLIWDRINSINKRDWPEENTHSVSAKLAA